MSNHEGTKAPIGLYDGDALNIVLALGTHIRQQAAFGAVYGKRPQSEAMKKELAALGRTRIRMSRVYRTAQWPVEGKRNEAQVAPITETAVAA